MVSISGCDPLDPGSNPGTANPLFDFVHEKKQVLPGLEPGLQGSEPWVLTNYTIEPSSCSANGVSVTLKLPKL